MIKSLCFLLILVSSSCFSQSYKTIDSLFIVKDYLMEIRTCIPKKESAKIPDNVKQLEQLIRLGIKQRSIFENQLDVVLKNNPREKKQLIKKYNFALQSAILLQTDLKQNNYFYNTSSLKEASYLQKHCDELVDKIYYHCKRFKGTIEINTH